jgi:NAD(P)-dependent dehydrogenase (short-subunit alcohol dehydrogenase family)
VNYNNQGRVVLVTGSSQGIGAAICRAFLQSGASVLGMDVVAPENATESQFVFIHGDTSCEQDCRDAVAMAVSKFAGLDVLVNNAAIQPKASYVPLHELPSDVWDRIVSINLTGYSQMAKHAIPVMLGQGSGVVINMASGQGVRTARQVAAYGPIKAANRMQACQWGVEYARQGIRVVSISPGAVNTPLVQASLAEQGGESELANRHPLGRIASPDEIAAAVLWLSSSAASFVTATDLEVDGGLGAFGAFADPYPRI